MARKKPGPKARRRNPSPRPDEETGVYTADGRSEWVKLPLAEWTAWVAVGEIDRAERALRRGIKTRRRELNRQADETMAVATARVVRLVLDVAEESAEFLWWTSRLDMDSDAIDVEKLYPMKRETDGTWTRRYLGPGPKHGEERRYRIVSRPQQRQEPTTGAWVPTDTLEWFIEEYAPNSDSWKPLRVPAKDAADAERWLIGDGRKTFGLARPMSWRPVRVSDLAWWHREPVGRMLRRQMGKAGSDGRYAYLAYVLLGLLLDLTPLQIRTLLDNFRRPRHRSEA